MMEIAMSLTFALLLTASAVAAPAPAGHRWHRVAAAAHEMGVPTPRLYDALSAAKARRAALACYCFEDRLTDPASPAKVCRTRAEWATFGLEPIADGAAGVVGR
jgi:hypothetical protein